MCDYLSMLNVLQWEMIRFACYLIMELTRTILGCAGLFLIDKYDLAISRNQGLQSLGATVGHDLSITVTVILPVTVEGITRILEVLICSSISASLAIEVDFTYLFEIQTDFS